MLKRFEMDIRTGKDFKSKDLSFQYDSQIDSWEVEVHSEMASRGVKMASRGVKMASRGGPGAIREASGLQERF